MAYYVHLIPQTTQLIQETLKITLPNAENAIINDLRQAVLAQLAKGNDGNKEYKLLALT